MIILDQSVLHSAAVCRYVYWAVSQPVGLSVSLSVGPFSVGLYVDLSVCLSISKYFCLSV